jgi:hypothetical protein
MLFFVVFLIGLILSFSMIKVKSKWAKWVPAILFISGAIVMMGKAKFFPAEEMAVLGEIVYAMLMAAIAGGALFGGVIVHFLKKKKTNG